jgi:hypothetical protein
MNIMWDIDCGEEGGGQAEHRCSTGWRGVPLGDAIFYTTVYA